MLEIAGQNATISPTASAVGSPWLTAEESAAYCRLTLPSFYNVCRHIRRAAGVRKLLFRRADLDAFLMTKRRKPR